MSASESACGYEYCPPVAVAREGGCSCGAVRYRLTSEPMFVHCCHCLNCQRQTGSAFVINLLLEADRMELFAGEPQPVEVPRDDGSTQTIFRCPSARSRSTASTGGQRFGSSARGRSTSRRRSPRTSTSSRGRSCPGSRSPSRRRRSMSTTTPRPCGRPRAVSGSTPLSADEFDAAGSSEQRLTERRRTRCARWSSTSS